MDVEKFINPIKRKISGVWNWVKEDMRPVKMSDYPAHNPPYYSLEPELSEQSIIKVRERRRIFKLVLNGRVTSDRVTRRIVMYPTLTVADIEKTVGTLRVIKDTGSNYGPPRPPRTPVPPVSPSAA